MRPFVIRHSCPQCCAKRCRRASFVIVATLALLSAATSFAQYAPRTGRGDALKSLTIGQFATADIDQFTQAVGPVTGITGLGFDDPRVVLSLGPTIDIPNLRGGATFSNQTECVAGVDCQVEPNSWMGLDADGKMKSLIEGRDYVKVGNWPGNGTYPRGNGAGADWLRIQAGDLDGMLLGSRVPVQMSIETDDDSGVKLSGDSASPGNNQVYGTDGSGVKGWKADSAGRFEGYTTTATTGGTTTLTAASTWTQRFTGTLAQDVVLPVTSTLYLGFEFHIINSGLGDLTIKTSAGNVLSIGENPTIGPFASATIKCVLTSGTGTPSWVQTTPLNYINQNVDLSPNSTAIAPSQSAVTAFVAAQLAPLIPNAAFFDPTGGSISSPVLVGNIASVTWTAAGHYTVAFTNAEPDANYVVSIVSETQDVPGYLSIKNKGTSGFEIISSTPSSNIVTGEITYARADACAVGFTIKR